jgi:hypothetical protein
MRRNETIDERNIPAMRIDFADDAAERLIATAPQPHARSQTDLEMVEELLDRCWREVGATELNAKMTDIVRLLEFKNKLRNAGEAEQTFWSLIDRLRREELAEFGEL